MGIIAPLVFPPRVFLRMQPQPQMELELTALHRAHFMKHDLSLVVMELDLTNHHHNHYDYVDDDDNLE